MLQSLGHRICSDKFNFIITPIIVGVATSGLVFQNMYFFSTLTQQNQVLFRTVSFILYIMCFISFYQSIVISNSPPPNLLKPRLKKMLRNNHQFYTQTNLCHKQNNMFKPVRTSHCSVCKCVVRMDHHCPYINNCVGLKNLKAFILLTGYGGLFALMFLIFSVKYYFDLKAEKIQPLTQGEITIWLLLTFVSFLLTLSMCGLAISNIVMASKNITQLQMLKGHFRFTDKFGLHPNPFDLGALTNLNTVFDSDKWAFWLPTQIVTDNDGTQFKMIPQITFDDIKKLPPHIKQQLRTLSEKLIPKTIEQLRQKQIPNYKNTIFFYLGKQYRLNDEQQQLSQNRTQIKDYNQSQEKSRPQVQSSEQGKKRNKSQEEGKAKVSGDVLSSTEQNQKRKNQYQEQLQRQAQQDLKEIVLTGSNDINNDLPIDQQKEQYNRVIQQIYGEEAIIEQGNQDAQNIKGEIQNIQNEIQYEGKQDKYEEIDSQQNQKPVQA